MPQLERIASLSILWAALLLSACGGGGDEEDDTGGNGGGSSSTYTVGGTISGLSGSVTLMLNGANTLTVSQSGSFTFTAALANNTTYFVLPTSMPTNQVCTVTNGLTGTIQNANVTNVTVTCAAISIGGTIGGLTKQGLVLQLNGAYDLPINVGSTAFAFPSTVSLGVSPLYAVHIKTQPANQTCTILSSSGGLSNAAPTVNNIALNCIDNTTDGLSGTYQIASLNGQPLSPRGFLSLSPDGTYIFGLHSNDASCGASQGNGIEYGVYRWNRNTGAFALVNNLIDTNGECGIVDPGNALLTGALVQNPNSTLTTDLLESDGFTIEHSVATWVPVPSSANTLVGSWGDNQSFAVLSDGKIFFATTKALMQSSTSMPGVEDGCFTKTGTTTSGAFAAFDFSSACSVGGTLTGVDANGTTGFSGAMQNTAYTVTGDALQSPIGPLTPFPFVGSGARIVPRPYQAPMGFSISATVSGLSTAGLALQNNGGSGVAVPSGASNVTVATGAAAGESYAVTIQTQPAGQYCAVSNGAGVIAANVSNVTVNCAPISSATYTVGGNVTGLTGAGLGLRLNGQTGATFNTTPTAGSYLFGATLHTGDAYRIAVTTQPSGPTQFCFAPSPGVVGAGTVSAANNCTNTSPYQVSGSVGSLIGNGLQLRMTYLNTYTGALSAPVVQSVAANATAFNFSDTIPANGVFLMGIGVQPSGQTCTMSRGTALSFGNFTNVSVVCVNNVTDPLSGTYSFLDTDGRQYMSFNATGTFTTAFVHNDSDCDTGADTRHGNGVEYGVFNWNATTGALQTNGSSMAVDTNGECGLNNPADPTEGAYNLRRVGNTVELRDPSLTILWGTGTAVASTPSSLVGAFVPVAENGVLWVFHPDGTYLFVETQQATLAPLGYGQERGCYSISGSNVTFSVASTCRPDGFAAYDLAGLGGFVNPSAGVSISGPIPFTIVDANSITIAGIAYRRVTPN